MAHPNLHIRLSKLARGQLHVTNVQHGATALLADSTLPPKRWVVRQGRNPLRLESLPEDGWINVEGTLSIDAMCGPP